MSKTKDIQKLEQEIIDQLTKKETIDTNIYFFGEINGDSSEDLISELFSVANDLIDGNVEDPIITIYINTEGGEIYEMYAIQDVIDHIKKQGIIVQTVGLGQVMSAGLIILGCGTKGHRFVGKRARLMFHEISHSVAGSFDHVKTEFSETQYLQDQYIDTIVEISKKSKIFYKKLLAKKNNQYFTAEEAVKWGLADSIL